MKKALLTIGFLFVALNASAGDISVKVKGMVCSMCAQGIEKKFSKIDEVQTVKVDLDQKLVSIKTKDGKDISDDSINKIVTEAGYNVAGIERK